MAAYIGGTSTRKVDDLVRALGCDTGVSKSTVSRICAEIDEQVEVFRTRRLDHLEFPYVFLDATYVKARVDHHIVSRAVVVATGVSADGNREVLGLEVGDSEDEVFWTAFLRSLKDRASTASNWPSPTPTPASKSRSCGCSKGPPGNDARSI